MDKSRSVKIIDDLSYVYKKLCECKDVNDLIETSNHSLHHIFLSYHRDHIGRYVQGLAMRHSKYINPKTNHEEIYCKFYQVIHQYIVGNIDLVYHIRNKILDIAGNDLSFYIESLYKSTSERIYDKTKHLLWILGCDDGYLFYSDKRRPDPMLKLDIVSGKLKIANIQDKRNYDLDTVIADTILRNFRFTENLFFHKFVSFGNFTYKDKSIFRKVEIKNTIYRYNDFYRPKYKLAFNRNNTILKYYEHDTKNSLMLF